MKKKASKNRSIILALILIIIVAMAFVYNSTVFERNTPEIVLEEQIYWNLKNPIQAQIKDDSGIKRVLIQIGDSENNITLVNNKYSGNDKEVDFNITFPKTGFFSKKNQYYLTFEAVDKSLWNFFMGNKAQKTYSIVVDTKQPNVYTVANSYKVTKGGSGVVIFRADDENLKDVYVQTNYGKQFKAVPFNKKGYYITFVAWPVNQKNFSAEIVAVDLAGNIAKSRIKYFLQDKNYRISKIPLSDNFLNNSVYPLAEEFDYENTMELSALERFVFINEKIRNQSISAIQEVTTVVNYDKQFKIKPFFPLKNGAVVAGYGDFRVYEYNKDKVSQSYHLGLDMASTAEAEIVLSNSGTVAFAAQNGIYGNMVLIDHGLGIYSLYAHCSELSVNKGDEIVNGQVIGRTGKTGFVFGDHLHFGIVVQGIEVRPEEWLDEKWLKENIFDLVDNANKIINNAR
ncbi:MAG: peptidoglycan DD-metalloendopeptidase family protein [Campylobacteraceae bacterium]|jgi:murein DD-endopeptidase MepM/ murein hydrolase activator NlpD|nr:peptidoglycan DD-metalloendopeptidase family protein [Campylobacteraceae bacterium]